MELRNDKHKCSEIFKLVKAYTVKRGGSIYLTEVFRYKKFRARLSCLSPAL